MQNLRSPISTESRTKVMGMASLTDLIAEIEKEGRCPVLLIDAHKKTLEALVALAERLDKLERADKRK
jgi:RNase H-fold protein (predicted Holliday junction resolvase)